MPYKDLVKCWHEGVLAAEKKDLDLALKNLTGIDDPPSKILFNIGCIYILRGDLENALQAYSQSVTKDQCLAVGFFQRSYVHFKLERYEKALTDCHLALAQLRDNSVIDYKQLGLRHLLFAWEVVYNTAVLLCYLGKWEKAEEKLIEASRSLPDGESRTLRLETALDQIKRGVLLQPIHVPEGELFRPRKQEVDQLKFKDFLGKPKIISSVVPNDQYSGFEPLRPQKPGFYEPCREAMQGRDAGYHRVLVHYYPENSAEVAVKANSILYVLNKDGDWATAIHDGQKILIPTNFLEPVNTPKADMKKMNNGIPLPPMKMPPTRPNVKTTGNLLPSEDVPPRPTGDPPELVEPKRGETFLEMGVPGREEQVVKMAVHKREQLVVEMAVPPREQRVVETAVPPRERVVETTVPPREQRVVETIVPPRQQRVVETTVPPREQRVVETTVPPREQRVVETTVPPREQRVVETVDLPKVVEMKIPNIPLSLVNAISPSVAEKPALQRLHPKVETVITLQSCPTPKQETTMAHPDHTMEALPSPVEEDTITLQVHTEFTVDLSVRKDITYLQLQQLLRRKLQQQGEQMDICLSYRDIKGKQLNVVKEDRDLQGMWEQAQDKRLMLCCKDACHCVGRPILYRMRAVYTYPAEGPEDLTFNQGDIIDILSEVNEEWSEGHCNGSIGIFPKCFATNLSERDPPGT
ncbi:NADPH oxidase activator 1 [Mixophyes fleayi]|uniref:NADPH oxidase activator 1 n=1 Tax=Mixophyes fleayi TaxID=3061075 RepID=UPI003F4D8763